MTRIEEYGVFVRFGHGIEGMIHISNLSREHVDHPGDLLQVGESVTAEVLTVRHGGKRVGLGLKQLQDNPWKRLESTHQIDQIVLGRVIRTTDFGAFVSIAKGVEGLLHDSESGLGPERRLREVLRPGQSVAVRIVAFDIGNERMSLSCMHRSGARVQPDDVLEQNQLEELSGNGRDAATNLGDLLRRALGSEDRGESLDAS